MILSFSSHLGAILNRLEHVPIGCVGGGVKIVVVRAVMLEVFVLEHLRGSIGMDK